MPEEQGISAFTSDPTDLPGPEINELVWKNGQDVFRVGDFVYLLNESDTTKPLIGQIFNIYKSKEEYVRIIYLIIIVKNWKIWKNWKNWEYEFAGFLGQSKQFIKPIQSFFQMKFLNAINLKIIKRMKF